MSINPDQVERFNENESRIFAVFGKNSLKDLRDSNDDETKRKYEREFLAATFDIPENKVILLKQVHGNRAVDVENNSDPLYFADADAMYTKSRGLVLCIRTADCLPLFFTAVNSDRSIFCGGMIHAGWRGLKSGIIEKTIENVRKDIFNNDTVIEWEMRIGPAIGVEEYEVGPEVAEHFKETLPGKGDRSYLDLSKSAENRINDKDDNNDRIVTDMSFMGCTYNENEFFFSHRKGDSGRNLNVLYLK